MVSAYTNKSDASDDDDDKVKAQMSKVSFGALAKAQDALSSKQSADRKRKRGDDTSKSQEDKLEALRERLRQIKAEKLASGAQPSKKAKKSKTKAKAAQDDDVEDKKGASGDDSDSDAAPHARSSKHAPAVQSSKRMVSRKRNVVEVKKPVFRDPRFDNVSGPRPDEYVVEKRYSFLKDYRASEISELRNTIKKTKNESEKEQLKKKLLSMESQQKARENKERLQDVTREHKKKEKELVKEGKKPFFLKKCMSIRIRCSMFSILTKNSSRTKEDCFGRPLPEHEGEAARQGHRAPSQEGYGKGEEEYARRAAYCLIILGRNSLMFVTSAVFKYRYPFNNSTCSIQIMSYCSGSNCSGTRVRYAGSVQAYQSSAFRRLNLQPHDRGEASAKKRLSPFLTTRNITRGDVSQGECTAVSFPLNSIKAEPRGIPRDDT